MVEGSSFNGGIEGEHELPQQGNGLCPEPVRVPLDAAVQQRNARRTRTIKSSQTVTGSADAAASTASSSPGKRASRSSRRSETSRLVPSVRVKVSPASRRIRK